MFMIMMTKVMRCQPTLDTAGDRHTLSYLSHHMITKVRENVHYLLQYLEYVAGDGTLSLTLL